LPLLAMAIAQPVPTARRSQNADLQIVMVAGQRRCARRSGYRAGQRSGSPRHRNAPGARAPGGAQVASGINNCSPRPDRAVQARHSPFIAARHLQQASASDLADVVQRGDEDLLVSRGRAEFGRCDAPVNDPARWPAVAPRSSIRLENTWIEISTLACRGATVVGALRIRRCGWPLSLQPLVQLAQLFVLVRVST
jgi:hypothetical protein